MSKSGLRILVVSGMMLAAAASLSACATPAPTATATPGSTEAATSAPTATDAPAMSTEAPTATTPALSVVGGEGGEFHGGEGGEGGEGGAATVDVSTNADMGDILVDASGMTLYTLDGDTADTSTCTGDCVSHWPPLLALAGQNPTGGAGVTGALALLTRDDGTMQVTYNGHPLYSYTGDNAPGDVNGDGAGGGVWHVAKP